MLRRALNGVTVRGDILRARSGNPVIVRTMIAEKLLPSVAGIPLKVFQADTGELRILQQLVAATSRRATNGSSGGVSKCIW